MKNKPDEIEQETQHVLRGLRVRVAGSPRGFAEIAAASGLTGPSLHGVLNGYRRLRFEDVFKILKAIDLAPREFFRDLYEPEVAIGAAPDMYAEAERSFQAGLRWLVAARQVTGREPAGPEAQTTPPRGVRPGSADRGA